MGKFGWSLPPGCTHAMIEAQFAEEPCDVCGNFADDCICPECPLCGQYGDLNCYLEVDLGICGGLYLKRNF